jgi:hypothetical protein
MVVENSGDSALRRGPRASTRLRYTDEYIMLRNKIMDACSEAGMSVLRVIRPPYLNGLWLIITQTITDESYMRMRKLAVRMGLTPYNIFIREVGSGESTLCITLKESGYPSVDSW